MWSHEGVWFSRHGTLLATLETFVNQSPNGYYAHELADALRAEVQQPLRHLVEQQCLARMEMGGQFLYTDIESARAANSCSPAAALRSFLWLCIPPTSRLAR